MRTAKKPFFSFFLAVVAAADSGRPLAAAAVSSTVSGPHRQPAKNEKRDARGPRLIVHPPVSYPHR